MYEKKIEELLEIAKYFFGDERFNREKFMAELKKLRFKIDSADEFIINQIDSLYPGVGSCIFIDPDKYFGFRGCDFYKENQTDPHKSTMPTICDAKISFKQRLIGGEFDYREKENVIIKKPIEGTERVREFKTETMLEKHIDPIGPCLGPYKLYLIKRLAKALDLQLRKK